MLTQQELENLYLVLEQTQETLEQSYLLFQKYFDSDQFKPCFVIYNLMVGKLLNQLQRYIGIYIIYNSFKNSSNPLALEIIEMGQTSEDQFEKQFIYELFVQNNRDISQYQLLDLIKLGQTTLQQYIFDDDFYQYKQSLIDIQPDVFGQKQQEINKIIMDVDLNNIDFSIPCEKISNADIDFHGFSIDYIRPIPTPLDLQDEPIWLNPSLIIDCSWDYKMCSDNNLLSVVKELVQKAHHSTLNSTELKILNDALEKKFESDQKIVYNCGVYPQTFQNLVEKNPTIAGNILIKLHQSPQISQYFDKLVNMELTLSSLELVNKVANAIELPKEFLTLFISNCIVHCEENKKDKNIQNRLVRLVCVFIKSMIKNKIINPKDMYIELQAFCIEFSKISEASALFKMLKGLESGNKNEL